MASVTEKESEAPRLVVPTPSLLSYHLSLLRGPRSGIPVAGCWCWVLVWVLVLVLCWVLVLVLAPGAVWPSLGGRSRDLGLEGIHGDPQASPGLRDISQLSWKRRKN